jgi:hypothetical protein
MNDTFYKWYIDAVDVDGKQIPLRELLIHQPKLACQVAFEAGRKSALSELGHCKCTMSQKLTGDGCSVCNTTMAREIEAYREGRSDMRTEAQKVVESKRWEHRNDTSEAIGRIPL